MRKVNCECGHANPHGTILCESCGRVLADSEKDKMLIDMRYEGSARRSQTYKKTIVDNIWNFFSSVKVGVSIIIILLVASALGTIFPQEMYIPPSIPAEQYYGDEYGLLGDIYYFLGFHNLYTSWWYLVLIASLGLSLIVASLDRFVPLYRALKTQRVDRHEGFLKRQRIYGSTTIENQEVDFESIKKRLKAKRFKVREENGSILAEKGRFSRWGPYVNHIGLIIFLIGGMLRFVPGMYLDKVLWVREDEVKQIPGTDGQYFLKNEEFVLEVYEKENEKEVFSEAIEEKGMVAKNFQTNAILYERVGERIPGEEPKLKEVREQKIRVNDPLKIPLKIGNLALYQVEYKLDELSKMSFNFTHKDSSNDFGNVTIDLHDPKSYFDLGNGYKVRVLNYYPDMIVKENGEPGTKSRVPNNPAFVFEMIAPDKPEGEVSVVAIRTTIEGSPDNSYKMTFAGVETKHATALTVRKDLTLPVLGLGGFIFMIGVIQGSYWNHRRIWIQKKGDEVLIAAHTNKNWHGLKRDLGVIIEGLELNEPEDRDEKKESSQ